MPDERIAREDDDRDQHPSYTLVLNGRRWRVHDEWLIFQELIELAFEIPPTGEHVIFTITYSRGRQPGRRGTLPVRTHHLQGVADSQHATRRFVGAPTTSVVPDA